MLTLEEAAAYVGMSPEDLMLTRHKGLPPGSLGVSKHGEVFFNQDDLLPASPVFNCDICGRLYKTETGLTAHVETHEESGEEEGDGRA